MNRLIDESITYAGRSLAVRSTYPWSMGRTASETDTFVAATKVATEISISVTKGEAAHEPAFTFTDTYTPLTSASAAPKVPVCK
ncbi:MAG: hypothetical protein ACRDL5_09045 [Solirubrobacteraceae bacterium]